MFEMPGASIDRGPASRQQQGGQPSRCRVVLWGPPDVDLVLLPAQARKRYERDPQERRGGQRMPPASPKSAAKARHQAR